MARLRHPNCQISKCETCFADHMALESELEKRTSDDKVDHLGKYHLWLDENGIPAETEWGWGSVEAFEEINIAAYIKHRLELSESPCDT